MNQPDCNQFILVMKNELHNLIFKKQWKVVPKNIVPEDKRTILIVWFIKRKSNQFGDITKWKARLCTGVHRSIQYLDC